MNKPSDGEAPDPFTARGSADPFAAAEQWTHRIGVKERGARCATDSRGYKTPGNKGPEKLVLDATEGFIPLWAKGVTLRWRFNQASMGYFSNPNAAKDGLRDLCSRAVLAWGDAVPIKFTESDDLWDFEIRMLAGDDCDNSGCVLAAAFFPDAGRHQLVIYPKMLEQSAEEQIETLTHEFGHVFGLRHFFADVGEKAWPSVLFGEHDKFTIMNYGANSVLTDADRSDLSTLYSQVRSGALTVINGTPIVQVRPYHELYRPA